MFSARDTSAASGRDLAMIIPDINKALPSGNATPNPRPYAVTAPKFSTISYFAFQGTAAYNALQVSLNRRFAKGLSFTSGFTYGDGKDNVTGTGTSTGGYANKVGPLSQAIDNIRAYDWATNDFNVKYRWTFGANYELPFGRGWKGAPGLMFGGWQVNGTATRQTGMPFTVTDQTAVSGVLGTTGERPNLMRSNIRMAWQTPRSAPPANG